MPDNRSQSLAPAHHPLQPNTSIRKDCARSRRSPPEALQRRKHWRHGYITNQPTAQARLILWSKAARVECTSHSRRQITRRRPSAEGKLAAKECGAGCPQLKAPKPRQACGSAARIGVPGGRSPEGALRRREAAAEGTPRMKARGSKGRSPWNAGVQGAVVSRPPARRRHNEIERSQQRTTAFVETATNRAQHSPPPPIPSPPTTPQP